MFSISEWGTKEALSKKQPKFSSHWTVKEEGESRREGLLVFPSLLRQP